VSVNGGAQGTNFPPKANPTEPNHAIFARLGRAGAGYAAENY
jgi:hypothetical protein